jgi:hypothetical protein
VILLFLIINFNLDIKSLKLQALITLMVIKQDVLKASAQHSHLAVLLKHPLQGDPKADD